jgi:glutamine---fructose-6-phosphate transaminase (isomerizing)
MPPLTVADPLPKMLMRFRAAEGSNVPEESILANEHADAPPQPSAANDRDLFMTEILDQPPALRRAAALLDGQADYFGLTESLRDRRGPLLLTGMGSSFHACQAAASALGQRGVLAVTTNTAEFLHFQWKTAAAASAVVLVSQSGRSVEVLRLAQKLMSLAHRPRLIAITNGTDNPLTPLVDVCLDTAAGAEVGPSTKSYAATFVPLAALVETISAAAGRRSAAAALSNVAAAAHVAADAADQLIMQAPALAESLFEWLDGRRMVTILGRGVARGPAETSALVLKEAARFPAEALDAADFRHGPLELAGPDLAVVLLSLEEATRRLDDRLAVQMASHKTAVLVVGDTLSSADGVRELAIGRIEPLLACATAVIPAQLLAWRLARAVGRRPGEFRLASKVTTEE